MKRTCRILVCLIAAIMLVSALPLAIFAQDGEPESTVDYVTSGLVSWYDASNHGTSDTVWEDLYGNNDITVVSDGTSCFTDDAYHLYNNSVQLPAGIDSTIRGAAFTVEFSLGDVNRTATWTSILGCTTTNKSEDIGFWITNDAQLTFGTKAGRAIFDGSAVSDMVSDATLTITYDTVKKEQTIYMNGVLLAKLSFTTSNPAVSKAADALKLSLGHPEVGSNTKRKNQEVNYRSIRFYNRALSETEIKINAVADGVYNYVTDGLVSRYDADDRGTTDGVWKDLVGVNDITVEKGYSYSSNSALEFNDKGLYLKDTGVWLPDALRDLTLGDAFTMEFYVEDAALSGASWLGICTSATADNSGENIALYILQKNGTMALKFNGDNGQRPTTAQNVMPLLNGGALISVTFDTVAQAAVIYINGVEMGRKPVTNQALVSDAYGIALGTITKDAAKDRVGQELTYRSIRFYNRALSESEVETNAFLDGFLRYQEDTQYVSDGLVAHYDGANHGTSDDVWENLAGDYDFTVTKSEKSYFDTDGYIMGNTETATLPAEIVTLLTGNSFTMEFCVSDYLRAGGNYANLISSSSDTMSLFLDVKTRGIQFKSGPKNPRPVVSNGDTLLQNALVSITFTKGGECAIYINGIKQSSVTATYTAMTAAETVLLGRADGNYSLKYKSMRFYNRVLSESEIMQNAYVDGMYPGITIAQPVTNIVGDVAMTRDIGSAAELAEMMAADRLPAAAIYRINAELFVTDGDGNAFARLFDVIKQTKFQVLPIVIPEDLNAVDALAAFIKEVGFYDICILT